MKKKTIEELNAEFEAMTPKKKRLTICRDVLAHLESKLIKAYAGTYVAYDKLGIGKSFEQVHEALTPAVECRACALGSMLLAHTLWVDDLTIVDSKKLENVDIHARFEGFFNEHQLRMIECAFECQDNFMNADSDPSDIAASVYFGEQFSDNRGADEARLVGIMQNILDNDGTFIPTDLRRCHAPA